MIFNRRRPAAASIARPPALPDPAPADRAPAATPPAASSEDGADASDPTDARSFADLGIADDLVEALRGTGITSPFAIQALAIPDALAGRDICGKAKTGSGKTLAFGLPLVERTEPARRRRPHSLVLVPTRELANQIAEELTPLVEARGLWLAAVYGGVSMARQIAALHAGVDIVIATPGRLNDLLERDELSIADVRMVVLDEADQMADMGFLPQVERILKQIEGQPQTLLFSATLDGAVGELVRRYQRDPVRHEVESATVSVDELEHRFIGVTADTKVEVAARICAGATRALVFVRTTHGADRLVRQLGRQGLPATAIHGRQSQSKRERMLAGFTDGTTSVLVATNVAARGLHVDGVDLVVHFDPPEDHKTYLHRSGRTARAGEEGMVVTLVLPEQERDIAAVQQGAGVCLEVVSMRPSDQRLSDLESWAPPAGTPFRERAQQGRGRPGGGSPAPRGTRGSGGRGRR